MPGDSTQSRAVASSQPECPVCYNLDRHRFPVGIPPYRLPTLSCEFKQLARAGKKGCQLCYAIKTATLLMMGFDARERKLNFDLCIVCIELSDLVRVVAIATYSNSQGNMVPTQTSFELFTKPEKPSPWPAFGAAHAVTPTLHSRRRQKMVRDWIDDCTASHSCRSTMLHHVPSAPRRYLDLGTNPRNGVKLVDTSASPGSYVAIIHGVAGPLPPPSSFTTVENLEERQRRMHWWQIPVALQEALSVAHEQGLRYAWIPDFCVLHGDEEDYNWHLDREDVIFRLAHFTIALTDTSDLRLSNFRPVRNATADGASERSRSETIQISRHGRTYPIQVRQSMHWSHWIMAERALLQPMDTKTHHFALMRHRMELLRHAPSFQRILLSPRVLHLHRSEMVWDCLEGWACECGDENYLTRHKKLSHPLPRALFHKRGYVENFGHVFQMYMNLPFSEPDQRLAHMTSMLRHSAQITGRLYYAAIPACSPTELAEELMWHLMPTPDAVAFATEPVAGSRRHHTPRIPTWSWASMVLAKEHVVESAATMLPPLTLGPLVPSHLYHFWDAKSKMAPGSAGDGLLASEYLLEISAVVVRGRAHVSPEQVRDMHPGLLLLFTPETAPGEIPYRPTLFSLDCEELLSSVKSSQDPVIFYFLLLGEMVLKKAAADPLSHDGSVNSSGDVGLVLRSTQRDYAPDAFERVGVFAMPSGFYRWSNFTVQRVVLV